MVALERLTWLSAGRRINPWTHRRLRSRGDGGIAASAHGWCAGTGPATRRRSRIRSIAVLSRRLGADQVKLFVERAYAAASYSAADKLRFMRRPAENPLSGTIWVIDCRL